MKEIKAIIQPHRLEAVLEKSRTQMHSKLILGLAVLFVTSSSFGLSGELGDLEFPESFDRTAYFAAYFSELEDYAKLLEHLYASPKSDTTVISEIERLIAKKTVLVWAINLNVNELPLESVDGLLAVLRVSEYENFGGAWSGQLILRQNIEALREIQPQLEERRQYLHSLIHVD